MEASLKKTNGIPKQEVHIDLDLVQDLIKSQAPKFADLPISAGKSGWDNCLFRLGKDWQVRLPRRIQALQNQQVETAWLPKLKDLPVAIPKPVFIGQPHSRYPWPWTIVPWFEGEIAQKTQWQDPRNDLLPFFEKLHNMKVDEAPHNPFRSCLLKEKEAGLLPRIKRLRVKGLFQPIHQKIWQNATLAPGETRVLIHGDLHPGNILLHRGKLAAILDWGDLCLGERAVDLASLWLISISEEERQLCFKEMHVSRETICKSKGWALFYGVLFSDLGLGESPDLLPLGAQILSNLRA